MASDKYDMSCINSFYDIILVIKNNLRELSHGYYTKATITKSLGIN